MGQRSGDSTPQQQPIRVRVDDAGSTTDVPYETSDFNQLAALLASNASWPMDYESRFGGGARVTFHYPYNFSTAGSNPATYAVPLWEFFANKVNTDIRIADLPWGTIGPLIPADAVLIHSALSIQEQGVPINANWFSTPTDVSGTALKNSAGNDVAAAVNPSGCYTVFLLFEKNQKDYPIFAPVLRYTQTVTSAYAIAASLVNVRRILSRSTLITAESVPGALLFSIPNDPVVTQYVQTPGDQVYGWFKDFPTVRQIARLKWNIVQEWQYGLWPTAVYGARL